MLSLIPTMNRGEVAQCLRTLPNSEIYCIGTQRHSGLGFNSGTYRKKIIMRPLSCRFDFGSRQLQTHQQDLAHDVYLTVTSSPQRGGSLEIPCLGGQNQNKKLANYKKKILLENRGTISSKTYSHLRMKKITQD